jgi:hypothetical protein
MNYNEFHLMMVFFLKPPSYIPSLIPCYNHLFINSINSHFLIFEGIEYMRFISIMHTREDFNHINYL